MPILIYVSNICPYTCTSIHIDVRALLINWYLGNVIPEVPRVSRLRRIVPHYMKPMHDDLTLRMPEAENTEAPRPCTSRLIETPPCLRAWEAIYPSTPSPALVKYTWTEWNQQLKKHVFLNHIQWSLRYCKTQHDSVCVSKENMYMLIERKLHGVSICTYVHVYTCTSFSVKPSLSMRGRVRAPPPPPATAPTSTTPCVGQTMWPTTTPVSWPAST